MPKKQVIIFLEVPHERTTFEGFGASGNTKTADCCLVSDSYECNQVSSPVIMLHMDFADPNLIFLAFPHINLNEPIFELL